MAFFNQFITSLNLDPVSLGSNLMMPTAADSPVKQVKRRACDECRTRKLACSKDSDGCERCRRENIVCHYSEQKPMGRPRKRQHVEERDENNERRCDDTLECEAPLGTSNYTVYENGAVGGTVFSGGVLGAGQMADITSSADSRQGCGTGIHKWQFGDFDINPRPPLNFADFGAVPIDDPARSLGTAPQLLADASTVTNCDDSSNPPGPCSCLASMYLSLAALQQLPTDIVAALFTVRSAARTASQSIWCPQCGSIALDTPSPPIEAFQNTMLLGTILPIIANGYHRLLKMVDEETDLAEAAGQTKAFRFNDYGGLCGKVSTVEMAVACFEKDLYFNPVEMAPQQWRTTVRAMLRVDIYGHEQPGFRHKGLKDLVSEMEARQIARHALVDAYQASGTMETNVLGNKLCIGEKTHTCLDILKMAKYSIDNLVIA